MGIVKLSSSGKALLFVTDEGVVYVTSVKSVEFLIARANNKFTATLTRMAEPVSPERFPKSPVYTGNTGATRDGRVSQDAFGPAAKQNKVEAVAYTDKEVL